MKRVIVISAFLAFAALGVGRAQTNIDPAPVLQVLPSPTQHAMNAAWANTCPTGVTCTFDVYRCAGAISACNDTTVTGSAIWLKINLKPIAGLSFQDTTVSQTPGTIYSYVAYADAAVLVNGVSTAETAGPSNEVAATVPPGPVAPALSIATQ